MTTLIYLGHRVEISLPDPFEDNTICIGIYREEGYDPETYNEDLMHYQFSAESADPNEWVMEALKSAIAQLTNRGVKFYEQRPVSTVSNSDEGDIPF